MRAYAFWNRARGAAVGRCHESGGTKTRETFFWQASLSFSYLLIHGETPGDSAGVRGPSLICVNLRNLRTKGVGARLLIKHERDETAAGRGDDVLLAVELVGDRAVGDTANTGVPQRRSRGGVVSTDA